jgi:hypothetical protein
VVYENLLVEELFIHESVSFQHFRRWPVTSEQELGVTGWTKSFEVLSFL